MPRGGKRTGSGRKAAAKKPDPLEKLDVRRRRYAEERSKGNNKFLSGVEAGFSENMAKNAKANIETKDFQAAFAELIRAVIPSEKIVTRIAEGMDATQTNLYSFQGEIFDERDLIAWKERREYTKLAAECGRYYTPKVELTGAGGGPVVFSFLRLGAKKKEA
jgi:hypothetical protein